MTEYSPQKNFTLKSRVFFLQRTVNHVSHPDTATSTVMYFSSYATDQKKTQRFRTECYNSNTQLNRNKSTKQIKNKDSTTCAGATAKTQYACAFCCASLPIQCYCYGEVLKPSPFIAPATLLGT